MYSCHQTGPALTGRRDVVPLVLLFKEAIGSTLDRHLIHLSLHEPAEPAPNKELGESGDGRGVKGKGGKHEGERRRSSESEKGLRKRGRQPRGGEDMKCEMFFTIK